MGLNMNVELWYILIFVLSGGLWAFGGTEISKTVEGQKWIRRFLLPVALGLCLKFGLDVATWKVASFSLLSMASFSMGYGDRSPWWKFKGRHDTESGQWIWWWYYPKWVTAICIYLPTVFIGLSWWLVIAPIVFLLTFWLSRHDRKSFRWKIVEFIHGSMVGLCLVGAL